MELSPEDKAQIGELKTELQSTTDEISKAETESEKYEGGLIKLLIQTRIEVLKTNKALLEQRINAIESGAPVTIETKVWKPNDDLMQQIQKDIEQQESELDEANKEVAKYEGGLIKAMAQAQVATIEQSLAMLQQQYLLAKYGLAPSLIYENLTLIQSEAEKSPDLTATSDASKSTLETEQELGKEIIEVVIMDKQLMKQDYQEYVFFKLKITAPGLDKNARAIKGIMNFNDLFGETMMRIKWTIDEPVEANGTLNLDGGFTYNQFLESNRWVANTDIKNMAATYSVESILYEDGTRLDF